MKMLLRLRSRRMESLLACWGRRHGSAPAYRGIDAINKIMIPVLLAALPEDKAPPREVKLWVTARIAGAQDRAASAGATKGTKLGKRKLAHLHICWGRVESELGCACRLSQIPPSADPQPPRIKQSPLTIISLAQISALSTPVSFPAVARSDSANHSSSRPQRTRFPIPIAQVAQLPTLAPSSRNLPLENS